VPAFAGKTSVHSIMKSLIINKILQENNHPG